MSKQFTVAGTDRVFTAHFAEPWNDCLVTVVDRATLTAEVERGCERVLPPGAPILRFEIDGLAEHGGVGDGPGPTLCCG